MTFASGEWRYFKWPYQAKVMKMLEIVRSSIVVIQLCCLIRNNLQMIDRVQLAPVK